MFYIISNLPPLVHKIVVVVVVSFSSIFVDVVVVVVVVAVSVVAVVPEQRRKPKMIHVAAVTLAVAVILKRRRKWYTKTDEKWFRSYILWFLWSSLYNMGSNHWSWLLFHSKFHAIFEASLTMLLFMEISQYCCQLTVFVVLYRIIFL